MDFLSLLTGVSLFFINFSNGIWLAQCDCILIQGQQETEDYDESQGPTESINGIRSRSLSILKVTLCATRYISYHWSP